MVTLVINENFWSKRELNWDRKLRELKLQEISVDAHGVTFYYRPDKLSEGKPPAFDELDRITAVARLQKLFPRQFIVSYSMRITLGTSIDMLVKFK